MSGRAKARLQSVKESGGIRQWVLWAWIITLSGSLEVKGKEQETVEKVESKGRKGQRGNHEIKVTQF